MKYKVIILFTASISLMLGHTSFAQDPSEGNSKTKEIAHLKTVLRSDADASGINEYDTFLDMAEMIESGDLFYVTEEKDGVIYQGWVNDKGLPHGIFKKTNSNGDYFVSAFANGNPIAFGEKHHDTIIDIKFRLANGSISFKGVFDNKGELNGYGIYSFKTIYEQYGKYFGSWKKGVPSGIGIMNNDQIGFFENWKLVSTLSSVAEAEYENNKSTMLDANIRMVENMDMSGGVYYTGNWKNGEPYHYGISVQNKNGRWYGSLVGNKDKL